MNSSLPPYDIFPLGDSALTLDFGNMIDEVVNREVIRLFYSLKSEPLDAMTEAVPAYSSLTIYYDPVQIPRSVNQSAFSFMQTELENFIRKNNRDAGEQSRSIRIPVCYEEEFAPDLSALASGAGLSIHEVVELHTSSEYRVYMMGFLPGFAYMGIVNEKISIPRKPLPQYVKAGSVGIAGSQTGIYPLDSPGGWQIIGRTPLQLFDADKKDPVLLRAGDRIRFFSIKGHEFKDYQTGIA